MASRFSLERSIENRWHERFEFKPDTFLSPLKVLNAGFQDVEAGYHTLLDWQWRHRKIDVSEERGVEAWPRGASHLPEYLLANGTSPPQRCECETVEDQTRVKTDAKQMTSH